MSEQGDPMESEARLKRAFQAIQKLRTKLEALESAQAEPIAIIGIGCRFPRGVDSPEAFWKLLDEGQDAIREVPEERWDLDALYDPELATPGKMNTRWGGFLDRVDHFDPAFFGISSREAAGIDPQQRLLLEVAWEALENAGIAPTRLSGSKTGVFVGVMLCDFYKLLQQAPLRGGSGISNSITANRLSFTLDLRGPSVSVDTACSSSLVSVDLACQSLRAKTSSIALAGGVNVILNPEITVASSWAGMMSPDGRCKTFDARANGYVRGEGCGIVVLKRLSDAQADGDRILALIRGSAVNQDGRTTVLTAPSGLAQREVIRQALERAGLSPEQINYVEAHGTGTALGDPIEVEALADVVGRPRPDGRECVIGSVKTNIGHTEGAAGIAGLIKVVLSLQNETIPSILHYQKLNPNISLEGTALSVASSPRPWPSGKERRFAAVSSFGFGGTNAHVVLEEAPAAVKEASGAPDGRGDQIERPLHLLPLSAKSEAALREVARRYAGHLSSHPEVAIADLCHTAGVGRTHFAHRLAITAGASADLRAQLSAFADSSGAPAGVVHGKAATGQPPKVAFLFTGQGSQYAGMGMRLYDTQPVFRRALDQCDEILRAHLPGSASLIRLLRATETGEGGEAPLYQTAFTQPALFALEYALAELWRSFGITPHAVMGHSVGEYVAACVAGAMDVKDGLALIAARARLMQALPKDGMMALVTASEERVLEALRGREALVSIAAQNAPNQTVIAGETRAVQAILDALEEDFILSEPLHVSHAFHSPLIEPMLDAFEAEARRVSFAAPVIPLVSNLTGSILKKGEVPDAAHWRRHARSPVRFLAGMQALAEAGCRVFVEIGPHLTLSKSGKKCLPGLDATWLPSLERGADDWKTLLASLSALYVRGHEVDFAGFDRGYARRRIALPTYPFERKRYWPEPHEIKSYAKEAQDEARN